jgi:hypothetical protein
MSDGAPINVISIKVLSTPGDVEIAWQTVTVDPNQSQWDLTIDVPLNSDAAVLYFLDLELISDSGGVQTVEL